MPNKPINIYSFILMILFAGCIANNQIHVGLKGSKKIEPFNISVTNVQILNHQIILTGSNLNSVSQFEIREGSNRAILQIESKNSTSIVANTISNVSFAAGKIFDFVLSNANASSTFTINFSLCDSTLGGKAIDCLVIPNDKDVLSFDAVTNKWIPRNVNGLNYKGTLDASLGANPIGSPASGDYYVINKAGVINTVIYVIGDWIVYNSDDLVWQQVSNSKDVLSVFGRKGNISAKKGDYVLSKMGDVDFSTLPALDQVLKFNGTNWVPSTISSTSSNSAGSAVLPGYSFSGNDNTGFFSPASNQIGISNNGIETIRFDATGKIGIGTTSPTVQLHIYGSTGIRNENPTGSSYTDTAASTTSGTGSAINRLWIGNTPWSIGQDSTHNFQIIKDYLLNPTVATVPAMMITSLGNVGIGTTSPGSLFDIKGILRLSGATSGYVGFAPAAAAGSTTYTLPVVQGSAGQVLSTNGVASTPTLSWVTPSSTATTLTGLTSTTGNISAADSILSAFGKLLFTQTDYVSKSADQTINGTMAINSLTGFITVPTPILANDAVNKSYVDSFGQWATNSGNVYRAIGNVGIGTTTPNYVLDVTGDLHSSTNLRVGAGSAAVTTSGTNDIKLIDGGGNTLFRGTRAAAWTDSTNSGFFQIGNSSDNVAFTSQSGTKINRLQLSSNVTQIGGNYYNSIPAPLAADLLELIDGSNNVRMVVQNAGNVGIGTTTPNEKLEVFGNNLFSPMGTSSIPGGYLSYNSFSQKFRGNYWNSALGSTNVDAIVTMKPTNANTTNPLYYLNFTVGSNTNILNLRDDGNVGIGTMSPAMNLDVNIGATPYLIFMGNHVGFGGIGATWGTRLSAGSINAYNTNYQFAAVGDVGTSEYINFLTQSTSDASGVERMRIAANGNVGIGTTSPSYMLDVQQSSGSAPTIAINTNHSIQAADFAATNAFWFVNSNLLMGSSGAIGDTGNAYTFTDNSGSTYRQIKISSLRVSATSAGSLLSSLNSDGSAYFSGNVGIGTTSPGFTFDVNGSIAATGALQSHSDRVLKTNINKVENSLAKILAINGVSFDWRKDEFPQMHFEGGRQLGVIAQDVEKVFPEAVTKNKDGIRSVAYTMLIAPMIEAFKEVSNRLLTLFQISNNQSRSIASIISKTEKLEKENAQLKKENSDIKSYLCQKDPKATICLQQTSIKEL
jgi:hypothetical protein